MFEGSLYAQGNNNQTTFSWAFITESQAHYGFNINNKSVLDIGCGDGKLLSRLSEEGPATILGIDVSESQLQIAKQRVERGTFICASFNNDFTCDAADVVVSTFALHFAQSVEQVFKRVYACVRPGGCFHAAYPITNPVPFMSHAVRKCQSDPRFSPYLQNIVLSDVHPNGVEVHNQADYVDVQHTNIVFKALFNAGFMNIHVAQNVRHWQWGSRQEVLLWARGINLFRESLPIPLLEAYDGAICDAVMETPFFFGPGRLEFALSLIEIHCSKE